MQFHLRKELNFLTIIRKSEGRQRTALGEATTSTDAKITNGRYRRTRLYSNNSSSSIKSSSRRGRSRRHRHKRKKKSEKKMMQSDEKVTSTFTSNV